MTFNEWINEPDTTKNWPVTIQAIQDDGEGGTNTKTIYLINRGVKARALGGEFYEPALDDMPRYSRKIQNIFSGRALISYGSVKVFNTDGQYDEFIDGTWTLDGQAITSKLGGDELSFSEYQLILSAFVDGKPTGDDVAIDIKIKDMQIKLEKKLVAASTYTDKVHVLIKTALTNAGYTYPGDFNTTLWTTFETDYDYTVSVTLSGATSTWSYIDQLTKGLAVWHGMSRVGKFEIGEFKLPTGSEDAEFTEIELFTCKNTKPPDIYWSVEVGYNGNTQGTSTSDSSIQDVYEHAKEGGRIQTAITNLTDAQAERDKQWTLRSTERRTLTIKANVKPFTLKLNDQVKVYNYSQGLEKYRYGLNGKLFRIYGIREDYKNMEVELDLIA